jgi:ATP-dependent DNA ligase
MSRVYLFPELHNTNKAGKAQTWKIYVEKKTIGSAIITKHGLVDGKITTAETLITEGKNLGKANATDDYIQAISQAKYKWEMKKRQGYFEQEGDKLEKAKIYLPMLAHSYEKRGKDITFPAFCQSKLDGIRAIYNSNYNKLQSRTGKIFPGLSHIVEELKTVTGGSPLFLDGELYSSELTFQEISGIVRKEKLTEKDLEISQKIRFVVYDIVLDKDYIDRLTILQDFFKNNKVKYSNLLKTEICKTPDQIKEFHDTYVQQGYEGLIIRNYKGTYEHTRSKNLQKYKDFEDDEFKIVGFTDGTGIENGLVIWECEAKQGTTFHVRPQGTHEERKKLFKNGKNYIGKMLTVKFFGYTDLGLPRFPIGVALRNYE